MSADIGAGYSDLYAAVDLNKKRRNKAGSDKTVQESSSGIPLYSVVNKAKRQSTEQEGDISILKEMSDNISSADVFKAQMKDCKVIAATTTRKYDLPKESQSFAIALSSKLALASLIFFFVVIGIFVSLFITLFVKIESLESSQMLITQCVLNHSHAAKEGNILCDEFERKLGNILNKALSNISSSPDVNEPSFFSSCADILNIHPTSSSGYYTLRSSTGQLVNVYCDMTRTCGNITGGWMRVAELDFCPCFMGLKLKMFNGTRTCIVENDNPGCTPVQFSSFNIRYSRVCGKVRGYGLGTVDGLYNNSNFKGMAVTDNYLDGVSISSNGSHIWSFVAGHCFHCESTPVFIGNDWTCDQCENNRNPCHKLLWNSSECGQGEIFLKHLSNPIATDITLKICRDEERVNEDVAISVIELYVY